MPKTKSILIKISGIVIWIVVFMLSYSLIKYFSTIIVLKGALLFKITPIDFENFSGIIYGILLLLRFGGGFYFADKAYKKIKSFEKNND
jgi:hypothetical protein